MPKGVYERTVECNQAHYKHGMNGTRLYRIWQAMKARCSNHNDINYIKYGAKGISVCSEWECSSKFIEWSLNNGYEDQFTLDRINNEKGYSPDNCRWVTAKTQANNRKTNINITINERTKSLKEWCELFGLVYGTVWNRYKKGDRGEYLFRDIGKQGKKQLKIELRILENEIGSERKGL